MLHRTWFAAKKRNERQTARRRILLRQATVLRSLDSGDAFEASPGNSVLKKRSKPKKAPPFSNGTGPYFLNTCRSDRNLKSDFDWSTIRPVDSWKPESPPTRANPAFGRAPPPRRPPKKAFVEPNLSSLSGSQKRRDSSEPLFAKNRIYYGNIAKFP